MRVGQVDRGIYHGGSLRLPAHQLLQHVGQGERAEERVEPHDLLEAEVEERGAQRRDARGVVDAVPRPGWHPKDVTGARLHGPAAHVREALGRVLDGESALEVGAAVG